MNFSHHFNVASISGRYNDLAYSLTLPFFDRPMKLDGSHAGDFGFDPLGFTEEYDIYYMQECELRHARLAMLAAVGWPMSELVAPSWMLQDGRAPSVLNGVNPLSAIAILTTFAAFGFLEYSTSLRRTTGTKLGDIHKKDMAQVWKYGVAGDYNFDPANLYSVLGDDAIGRKALREVEVAHGRYAMMGITYFAAWEALTGNPIVANNPLFHPTAVVPLAAVSYFIWSQFYQVSDVRKFPIQIEFTKDGEEMLNGVQRSMSSIDIDTAPVAKAAGVLTNAVSDLVKSVQDKTQDENGSDNDSQGDSSDGGSSMKEKGADLLKKIKDMQESV